jgi:DNA-binding XRE family transcriptional regulator
MKPQQQQQARRMFIQSDLNKTEIADTLSVDRRTIYQWSVDGDWERLKTSAKCMPTMLAEKCYHLMGHFTDHLLSAEAHYQSVTKTDIDIIYKLAKTIRILKKGNTINEDMETFNWFLEGLQKRDANLAQALLPYADEFITCRTATQAPVYASAKQTDANGITAFPEKDILEKWRDEQDAAAIAEELRKNATNTANQNIATTPAPETKQPHTNTDEEISRESLAGVARNEAKQPHDMSSANADIADRSAPQSHNDTTADTPLTKQQKDQLRRANYQLHLQEKRIKQQQLKDKK